KSPSQIYAGYNLCTIVIITNPVDPVPLLKGEFYSSAESLSGDFARIEGRHSAGIVSLPESKS
ncbi:MAG TPA: hypothetical protein PK753_12610, partial [Ignavibacteria bacterium]|nr:hypothetical protein [Ignavibacteria bacterium]